MDRYNAQAKSEEHIVESKYQVTPLSWKMHVLYYQSRDSREHTMYISLFNCVNAGKSKDDKDWFTEFWGLQFCILDSTDFKKCLRM